jgi:hypothetical protein
MMKSWLRPATSHTCMYENVEFVIWALKSLGGMNPPPPEQFRTPSAPAPQPANDPRFAKPPAVLEEEKPLDLPVHLPAARSTEFIGRDQHMTSCPKFVP